MRFLTSTRKFVSYAIQVISIQYSSTSQAGKLTTMMTNMVKPRKTPGPHHDIAHHANASMSPRRLVCGFKKENFYNPVGLWTSSIMDENRVWSADPGKILRSYKAICDVINQLFTTQGSQYTTQ